MRDKTDKRIGIMAIILFILMAILFLASFKLMIIEGKEYRETSDTKRIKDVYTKAPRGDILDRKGRVLATTKNSFTVQLLADELKEEKKSKVNEDLQALILLLEEDGVSYGKDNPIDLYNFSFAKEEDYEKEKKLPEDIVIDTLVDKGLVKDFLALKHKGDFNFSNVSRAINVLELRSQEEIPIRVSLEGPDILSYKKEELGEDREELPEDPMDYMTDLVGDNKAIIRNILDHPISRKLTFDMLKSKKLIKNIELLDYCFKDDYDYLINKAELSKNFKGISLTSDPKDDFVLISTMNLPILLESMELGDKAEEDIIPAKDLIRILEKKLGKEVNIEVSIEDGRVDLSYSQEIDTTETPLDMLVRLAKEEDILYDFLTGEDIKFLAQDANTKAGITPEISVLEWDYIYVKNKADMLEKYDLGKKASPQEALAAMADYYELPETGDYIRMRMVSLHREVEDVSYRSFEPIVLTYGLKEETVAKLEEQISNRGIHPSQLPVRYYPEGTRAAHVLGYIGEISQPSEIAKYTEDLGYASGDLIGKTGVEESYETSLKGKDGKKVVQVDSMGNTTNILKETPPVKGNSLYLTLDLDLQKVAEEALRQTLDQLQVGGAFQSKWGEAYLRGNEREGRPLYNANSGSVVVLDVNTGEVLALANENTYDPNLFSTGISEADWKSLFPEDENNPLADRPLLNVAMQSAVQPGSIFKLNTALAGLENGMSPDTSVNCTGYIDIGDTRFGCWIYNQDLGAHGYEDVYGTIRDSCNVYFYGLALGENPETGEGLPTKLSVDDIREYAVKLGLDEQTGIEINIPYESSGAMPSPDEKRWIMKNLLVDFLEDDLELYVKEGLRLNPDKEKEILSAVIGLIDEPEMEYGDLEARLDEIGFNIEATVGDSAETIVERIKYTYIDQAKWNVTDMMNVVIGQGQNAYTPLQMANYMSTIANGGYKNKVSVIKEVKTHDNQTSLLKNEPIRNRIILKDYNNLDYLKIGMNQASHFGSLNQVFGSFPVEIGLKTGTAEREGINPDTGEGFDDYSWMIAFAPYDDPQIAICTLLYQAGSGSNGAAIVREVVGQYLGLSPESEEDYYEEAYDEWEEDYYEEGSQDWEEDYEYIEDYEEVPEEDL